MPSAEYKNFKYFAGIVLIVLIGTLMDKANFPDWPEVSISAISTAISAISTLVIACLTVLIVIYTHHLRNDQKEQFDLIRDQLIEPKIDFYLELNDDRFIINLVNTGSGRAENIYIAISPAGDYHKLNYNHAGFSSDSIYSFNEMLNDNYRYTNLIDQNIPLLGANQKRTATLLSRSKAIKDYGKSTVCSYEATVEITYQCMGGKKMEPIKSYISFGEFSAYPTDNAPLHDIAASIGAIQNTLAKIEPALPSQKKMTS